MLFLRLLREGIVFALQAIRVNILRSVLTLIGISIGIFVIVAVFTATGTLERKISQSINKIDDNSLFIQKWPWAFNDPNYAWWDYWKRPETTMKEAEEVERRSNNAEDVAFVTSVNRMVSFANRRIEGVEVMGVSWSFNKVWSFELQEGRYFSRMESEGGRNVAVIGAEIATSLFDDIDVIGRNIKLLGRKVKIVGVFKREGSDDFGQSLDNQIIIPVKYLNRFIDPDQNTGGLIIAKAKPNVSNMELRDELTGIMRSIRKLKPYVNDNFAINESNILTEGFDRIFSVVSLVAWIIGGFALLVGGFGIANIMFVSVKERTHQIGIQKSLGAKKYFILFQFLFEAIFLSVIGGIIGLLLVFIITLLSKLTDFELIMTSTEIFTGLIISSVIGLISGIIPAYRASSLDPVEAIRSHF